MLQTRSLGFCILFVLLGVLPTVAQRDRDVQNELLRFSYANYLGWTAEVGYCYWEGISCNEDGDVTQIDLSSRGLQTSLPTGWSRLSSLKVLRLDNNRFTGSIPDSYSDLESLEHLYLHNNQLSGELPSVLCRNLRRLKHLYLSHNQLSGDLPRDCSRLRNVEVIHLEHNRFSGTLPDDWEDMSDVKYIYLNDNQLRGDLPESWTSLDELRHLYLHNNTFSGKLPSEWFSGMRRLERLHLSGNQLEGSIPDEIGLADQLEELALDNNRLSGPLQPRVSNLRGLQKLYLYDNEFTGPLPSSWAVLAKLEELHLDGNQLTGQLPPDWGAMRSLEYLYLKNNQLSGPLPLQWAALSKLRVFYAWGNAFRGELPDAWGQMQELQFIVLNDNRFDGALPRSWGSLRKMEFLHLYDNGLSGTMPREWSGMSQLQQLVLRGNGLDGELPDEWRRNMGQLKIFDVTRNPQVCAGQSYMDAELFWALSVRDLAICGANGERLPPNRRDVVDPVTVPDSAVVRAPNLAVSDTEDDTAVEKANTVASGNVLENMGEQLLGSPGMGYGIVVIIVALLVILVGVCVFLCFRARSRREMEIAEEYVEASKVGPLDTGDHASSTGIAAYIEPDTIDAILKAKYVMAGQMMVASDGSSPARETLHNIHVHRQLSLGSPAVATPHPPPLSSSFSPAPSRATSVGANSTTSYSGRLVSSPLNTARIMQHHIGGGGGVHNNWDGGSTVNTQSTDSGAGFAGPVNVGSSIDLSAFNAGRRQSRARHVPSDGIRSSNNNSNFAMRASQQSGFATQRVAVPVAEGGTMASHDWDQRSSIMYASAAFANLRSSHQAPAAHGGSNLRGSISNLRESFSQARRKTRDENHQRDDGVLHL